MNSQLGQKTKSCEHRICFGGWFRDHSKNTIIRGYSLISDAVTLQILQLEKVAWNYKRQLFRDTMGALPGAMVKP